MQFQKKRKEMDLGVFYPIFLIVATLFMSIGYAQISDVELNISGTTSGQAQTRSIYNKHIICKR